MRGSIFGKRRKDLDYRNKEETPRRALPFRVVPYSAEHKGLVAELQRHLWSPDTRLNASYLEWKYHQNPYIREPLIYLAFVGDKLAGMRGASGTRWEVGDPAEFFTLPYPDDLVIDPAYRRQGLHRAIMNFALRDLAGRGHRYVVNLSASQITAGASMSMLWRNAGRVKPLHRRTLRKIAADFLGNRARHLPLLWRWADSVRALSGHSGDHLFDRLDARFSPPDQGRDTGPLFGRKTPLNRQMAQLVARLPRDGRIRHVRDEAFCSSRRASTEIAQASSTWKERATRYGQNSLPLRSSTESFPRSSSGSWGLRPPRRKRSSATDSSRSAQLMKIPFSFARCGTRSLTRPGCWAGAVWMTPASGTSG